MFIKVALMHSFIHGFDHSPHALCEVVVLQYTILVLCVLFRMSYFMKIDKRKSWNSNKRFIPKSNRYNRVKKPHFYCHVFELKIYVMYSVFCTVFAIIVL